MAKKKSVMIAARNARVQKEGLKTSKGTIDFKGKSMLHIGDPALAQEIDSEYGLKAKGDIWALQDERHEQHINYKEDGVHGYFFGPSKKFANAWDEFEKRRKDKKAR